MFEPIVLQYVQNAKILAPTQHVEKLASKAIEAAALYAQANGKALEAIAAAYAPALRLASKLTPRA